MSEREEFRNRRSRSLFISSMSEREKEGGYIRVRSIFLWTIPRGWFLLVCDGAVIVS